MVLRPYGLGMKEAPMSRLNRALTICEKRVHRSLLALTSPRTRFNSPSRQAKHYVVLVLLPEASALLSAFKRILPVDAVLGTVGNVHRSVSSHGSRGKNCRVTGNRTSRRNRKGVVEQRPRCSNLRAHLSAWNHRGFVRAIHGRRVAGRRF